ncbi:alpha/beta-hydrolase [Trichodelitschia bisporula]|uniref:Alpha/beta-hydrolase n=1 Tax=Trichodelitschia bisporula TaxID=703511 RepID=A0A6G1HPQ5_9PEZI|nr:alpha/beta-hydrolase [Trichodelitschia bisporula]
MAPTPGILYVTMAPHATLPPAQFHDWYQNEHGPGRLRLPHIFLNGFRYRLDSSQKDPSEEQPEWMAIYDVTDMAYMLSEEYTRLRKSPVQSQRERDTMKQIKVDRKFYDLVHESRGDGFKALEDVALEGNEGNLIVAVINTLQEPGGRAELQKWYEEEHIPLLAKVPGWRRSRVFTSSTVEEKRAGYFEFLVLHEYDPQSNGLDGPEFKAAVGTPWRQRIFDTVIKTKKRTVYNLAYTFGPAPRDLASLTDLATAPLTFAENRTRTYPARDGSPAAIESYVITPDGCLLPYRLEGYTTDPQAPLLVLINSVLVEYGIWDGFIRAFFARPENRKFRVVRYNARGRSANCGLEGDNVTVDLLARDVTSLLDALRVLRAAGVIGVSLGGATSLNVALKYPERVAVFVACDTNAAAPEGNPKAWGERIALAESEQAVSTAGERVVGGKLAEITTKRWFVDESYDGGKKEKECWRINEMVKNNSLEGFKKGVKALYKYDFRDDMKAGKVKGAFMVGGRDGVLPKAMVGMKDGYADGTSWFVIIDNAGHLPMVEKPELFADAITIFLAE